jgi:alkanesulfonate monooxygenase SsuD/methylene tetrahydromethanopterin reductase-like flavin-dependent oxidoreductase (luciferase family)
LKFSIFVSMERSAPGQDMRAVAQHALDLVKLAEAGGFEIAWAAEHHTIELIIGPKPVHPADPLGGAYEHDPPWHGGDCRALLAPAAPRRGSRAV